MAKTATPVSAPSAFSTTDFQYAAGVFSQEASSLGFTEVGAPMPRDITLRNPKSERTVTFRHSITRRDVELDVLFWEYRSTTEIYGGLIVQIYND